MKFKDRVHFEEELKKSVEELTEVNEALVKSGGYTNPGSKPRFKHGSKIEIHGSTSDKGYHVVEHPADGGDPIKHENVHYGELDKMTGGFTHNLRVKDSKRKGSKPGTHMGKVINIGKNSAGDRATHTVVRPIIQKKTEDK